MWSDTIVLAEPGIDDDLSLFGGVQALGIEDFPSQSAVEALVVPVLPRRSWVDLDWLDPHLSQPILQCCRDELWAIMHHGLTKLVCRQALGFR